MEVEQHKKEVEKLRDLERKLSLHIAYSEDHKLMDLFLEWQDQRNVCNEIFVKTIETNFNQLSENDE